jgi:hypothetical protein
MSLRRGYTTGLTFIGTPTTTSIFYDVLSSFNFGAKVKLDELSRIMGLPG